MIKAIYVLQPIYFRAAWVALGLVVMFTLPLDVIGAQPGLLNEVAFSLPERGAKPRGFVVNFACGDSNSVGEIPVTIEVAPTGKNFPADRLITVRVSPVTKTTQPPGLDCTYDIPVPLVEGTSSATKTAYLPKWTVGGEFDVSVLEDRRSLDGYRTRIAGSTFSPNQAEAFWFESTRRRYGWINENAVDTRDSRVLFMSLMPELVRENDFTTPVFKLGNRVNRFRVVNVDQLPADWRGFDSIDVWIIEYDTLKSLVAKQPEPAKALNDYVRCGGTLWILGSPTKVEFDEWFSLNSKNADRNTDLVSKAIQYAGTPVDFEPFRGGYNSNIQAYGNPGRGFLQYTNSPTGFSDAEFDANVAWVKEQEAVGMAEPINESDYAIYDFALGRVVVCDRTDVLPGSPQHWRAIANMNDDTGSSGIERRAVDPCFGDRRFWDWVIPGVAQPPVYTFIGLLIVFVVIVGPLAYRKLTKLGRGYLMMFVAPLLAFATTLIMFAYGLVADGLSTRVRIREVTWIGDASGVAVRCNRATYFAGIRPAEGMRFPANSLVLPYQLSAVSNWFQASQVEHSMIGTIELADDAIRFDSGFLPSRQQKQFVTYRPVDKVGLVRVTQNGSPATTNVLNELSFELRQGVIRTFDGEYFAFDKLSPGATLVVNPVESKVGSKLLSELYGIQRPLPPPGISSAQRQGDAAIDLLAILYNQPRQASAPNRAALGDSVVESWIRERLQIRSELPPGMFVAVADVTDDCIAVESAELVESVHYVIGVLP